MAKAKRKATAESAVRRDLRTPLTSKQRWTGWSSQREKAKKNDCVRQFAGDVGAPAKLKAKGLEFEQYADARHLKFVHGKGVPKSEIHKIYKQVKLCLLL